MIATNTQKSGHFSTPDNLIELHCGDAIELLRDMPAGSIDALITDPPYCSGGLTAGDRARDPREKYCQGGRDLGRPTFGGDSRDQRSYLAWMTLWLSESRRLVREGGYALVFTDWRQLPTVTDALQCAGFIWRGVIAWNKGRGARAPHRGYFRHQCEYIVWGSNGRLPKAEHSGPFDGCIDQSVRRSDKHHMTGKPTQLMRQLVQCVPPGAKILDPFAGSGTTLVASSLEGRRCVGIEAEPAYFDVARKRLSETQGCEISQDDVN